MSADGLADTTGNGRPAPGKSNTGESQLSGVAFGFGETKMDEFSNPGVIIPQRLQQMQEEIYAFDSFSFSAR